MYFALHTSSRRVKMLIYLVVSMLSFMVEASRSQIKFKLNRKSSTSISKSFSLRSHRIPLSILIRGGSDVDDSELDKYVEKLLEGATSDEEDDVEHDKQKQNQSEKTSKKKRRRRSKSAKSKKTAVVEDHSDEEANNEGPEKVSDTSAKEEVQNGVENEKQSSYDETSQEIRIQQELRPPNGLQRFLLSYGYIGRILAAFTVLVSELFHQYFPEFHRLVSSFFPDLSDDRLPSSQRRMQEGVHSQYAAFASGATVGGKKISKDQKKQLDQVALNKLKHVKGGIKSGKYAHLSTKFMKKYNLGKYAEEAKMFESMIAPIQSTSDDKKDEMSESELDESDNGEEEEDWVLKALQDEKNSIAEEDELSSLRTSDKQTSVIDAARGSKRRSKTRKVVKVKGSDRDGGAGMMGRIRAVTASSGVSSRVLGAYPGDAVPIEEAASKYGVIALAERYGYGDWSDSEYDEEEDYFPKKKRGKRKRRKTKPFSRSQQRSTNKRGNRKSLDKSGESDFSVSFEFGTSMSTNTRHRNNSRSYSGRRKMASLTKDFTPRDGPRSSILGNREKDSRVRLPMERTSERNGNSSDSLRDRLSSRVSPSAVQAPMARTNEFKKKNDSSDSD